MPLADTPRDRALAEYTALITRYGLTWTAEVPEPAWNRLIRVLPWTTIEERRRVAGLPARANP
jgi:hypothetical protein